VAKRAKISKADDQEPRGNLAYTVLRDRIRIGKFKPGQRIREEDVADMLHMSRTPVREALKRLEVEGLVMSEPRRGMAIALLDHQMVIELYVMREALEGASARLAARHASDAETAMLEELVKEEEQLGPDVGSDLLAKHNRRFHLALYRAAHNRYLLQSLNALGDSIMLLGETTFALQGRPTSALSEHREIVDAIVKRDPDSAEHAARHHIQNALRMRFKLLQAADAANASV